MMLKTILWSENPNFTRFLQLLLAITAFNCQLSNVGKDFSPKLNSNICFACLSFLESQELQKIFPVELNTFFVFCVFIKHQNRDLIMHFQICTDAL